MTKIISEVRELMHNQKTQDIEKSIFLDQDIFTSLTNQQYNQYFDCCIDKHNSICSLNLRRNRINKIKNKDNKYFLYFYNKYGKQEKNLLHNIELNKENIQKLDLKLIELKNNITLNYIKFNKDTNEIENKFNIINKLVDMYVEFSKWTNYRNNNKIINKIELINLKDDLNNLYISASNLKFNNFDRIINLKIDIFNELNKILFEIRQ